ncbi:hypothetical protein ACFLTM_04475 [Candidatus Bipolaricaulota bacterium]
MALGTFLLQLRCDEDTEYYLDAALSTAHELPNGGVLWYYPDNYRLNRFLGPDLSPSAISQGRILGGLSRLDADCVIDLSEVTERVFLGLAFDYYNGGVCLEGSALLEIPLFRSAPEIILNGWLHALLHLHNYAKFYADPNALDLVQANLRFLSKILPTFHDEKTELSLYSDLSPYKVRVQHESGTPPHFAVFYAARTPELSDLRFDLAFISHDSVSPYDNQIVRQSSSSTDVWISCSQQYDTYLVSDQPITASMATGVYSPLRTMPGTGGQEILFASAPIGETHVIHVTSAREKLFAGSPTPFTKKGENYYHTQHIVALACILATFDLEPDVRETFQARMERWIETIESYAAGCEDLVFTPFGGVLRDLVNHDIFRLTDQWDQLLGIARNR